MKKENTAIVGTNESIAKNAPVSVYLKIKTNIVFYRTEYPFDNCIRFNVLNKNDVFFFRGKSQENVLSSAQCAVEKRCLNKRHAGCHLISY